MERVSDEQLAVMLEFAKWDFEEDPDSKVFKNELSALTELKERRAADRPQTRGYIVATTPEAHKAWDGRFFFTDEDARAVCEAVNREYITGWRVYSALVTVEDNE